MEMAKVTSKGQITIPVSIRRRLNINEGDRLLFIDRPEGVVMVNPDMLPGGKAAETGQDARWLPQGAETPIESQSTADASRPSSSRPGATQAKSVRQSTPAQPGASSYPPDATQAQPTQPVQPASPTPPEKSPGRQDEKLQGLDLSSLLNEIRSIGSNI